MVNPARGIVLNSGTFRSARDPEFDTSWGASSNRTSTKASSETWKIGASRCRDLYGSIEVARHFELEMVEQLVLCVCQIPSERITTAAEPGPNVKACLLIYYP
jgi:hypothetical protein